MKLTITSPAFSAGATIPRTHTCDGNDASPPISWSGAPETTKEFALICDDPDAPSGTFVHWVIWGIPNSNSRLPEGVVRGNEVASLGGAHQGKNGFGVAGYRGPCPPPGKPHRYFFKVFALDGPMKLAPGASSAQVQAAMKGHILAQGELVGTYGR